MISTVVITRATVFDLGTEFGIEMNQVKGNGYGWYYQGEVNFDNT